MKVYRTLDGAVTEVNGAFSLLSNFDLDVWFQTEDQKAHLTAAIKSVGQPVEGPSAERILPPISKQEVWAAGVTYLRSKTARMEESKDSGGGSFYDKVYDADRPELFFKSTPNRVAGSGQYLRLRTDSNWQVPEPELTLVVNARGAIFGYTIGNDLSSRDIEGANPLYLPQAKVWMKSAGLGPCIYLPDEPLSRETVIQLSILRNGEEAFSGSTSLSQIKRSFEDLVRYLFHDNAFPNGCFLMTGTGIVPPDGFSLQSGDVVRITVEPIGTLINPIA